MQGPESVIVVVPLERPLLLSAIDRGVVRIVGLSSPQRVAVILVSWLVSTRVLLLQIRTLAPQHVTADV